MCLCRNNIGQSISEYVTLLAVVALLIGGIRTYVQRGLQGRFKDASDSVIAAMNKALEERGAFPNPGYKIDGGGKYPNQYEPQYATGRTDRDEKTAIEKYRFKNNGGGTGKSYVTDPAVTENKIFTDRQQWIDYNSPGG